MDDNATAELKGSLFYYESMSAKPAVPTTMPQANTAVNASTYVPVDKKSAE